MPGPAAEKTPPPNDPNKADVHISESCTYLSKRSPNVVSFGSTIPACISPTLLPSSEIINCPASSNPSEAIEKPALLRVLVLLNNLLFCKNPGNLEVKAVFNPLPVLPNNKY